MSSGRRTQAECLFEAIDRRVDSEPFHYKDATKWVRKDYPGTYTGAVPHNTVHRDLSRCMWADNVGYGKGMFRLVNPYVRAKSSAELRKARKKALKLLAKAMDILERTA